MKTSEERNEESGGIKAGFETLGVQGRHDRHNDDVTAMVIVMMTMTTMMMILRRRRRIMMMNVSDGEKAYVTQLRCLAPFEVSTLKSDEWRA